MRPLLALLAAVSLSACPLITPDTPGPGVPGPRPLSGRLQPEQLELILTAGATDGQNNRSETSSVNVSLVSGRLPGDVFAPQRAGFAEAIASWPIDEAKKAELNAGVAEALSKLASDLNTSLDGLPRRMTVTTTSPPLGARFDFKNARGEAFSADGLYNTDTTEFFLGALSVGNGAGNDQLALLGLAAATFQGALRNPIAELRLGAAGVLAVANTGAVSVSIELKTTLRYTND